MFIEQLIVKVLPILSFRTSPTEEKIVLTDSGTSREADRVKIISEKLEFKISLKFFRQEQMTNIKSRVMGHLLTLFSNMCP